MSTNCSVLSSLSLLSLSLLLLLLLLLLGSTGASVWHHDEPDSSLSKIIYDRFNNRIIVAGSNSISMFDGLLQRLQSVETGPVYEDDCDIGNARQCQSDNTPRVLLPTPDGRHFIFLGSLRGDRATIHDSQNLNIYREIRSGGASFIGNGDNVAVAFGSDWSLFVAKGFDPNNENDSYSLTSFDLREELQNDMDYHHGNTERPIKMSGGMSFSESLRSNFVVQYIDSFVHENFVYYLTVQKESETEEIYHTKLVRVCTDDVEFNSYSELELSCSRRDHLTQYHVSYNIARAAHLSKMGSRLAQRLNHHDPDEAALYVAMGKGRGQLAEGGESVVCVYPMRVVQKEFVKLQRDCYSGIGMILPWIDADKPRCKMDKDVAKDIDNSFCGHPLNVGMGSRYPLHSDPIYHGHTNPITAIRIVIINNKTVAIMGTEKGLLLKHVLDDFSSTPYATINLNNGLQTSPVLSSMVVDSMERNLFALAGNRVSKVTLRSCDDYNDCKTCIGVHDPNLCGWCGDHCSTSDRCVGGRWQNDSCSPIIYSFSPKRGPTYGNTVLEIHGDNFGHPLPNVRASVTIGNASCSIKFRNNSFILCKTSSYSANYERELNVSIIDDLRIMLPYNIGGHDLTEGEYFTFKQPVVSSIHPSVGPNSGGTNVTIMGKNLNIGSSMVINIGGDCIVIDVSTDKIVCITTSLNRSTINTSSITDVGTKVRVQLLIDGTDISDQYFNFVSDPVVVQVSTRLSIFSGGQSMTIYGNNLNIIENPQMCVELRQFESCSDCKVNRSNPDVIVCPSPDILGALNVLDVYGDDVEISANIFFIMDGVKDVWKKTKSSSSSSLSLSPSSSSPSTSSSSSHHPKERVLRYYPDPRFEPVNKDSFIGNNTLKLEGSHLNWTARVEDYGVKVDDCPCNVTMVTKKILLCKLPKRFVASNNCLVTIRLGNFKFESKLNPSKPEQLLHPTSSSATFAYPHLFWIFLAAVVAVLLFSLTIYTAWMKGLHKTKEEKRSRTMPNVFYERAPSVRRLRGAQMEIFNVEEGYNVVSGNGNIFNGAQQRHLSNTYWPQTSNGLHPRPQITTPSSDTIMDERTKQLLTDLNLIIPRRRIILLESIGQGHFGCVYRGCLEDEQKSSMMEVAVKTLKSPPDSTFQSNDCKKFVEEAMTMQEFNHPHVLSLIGIVIDKGSETRGEGLQGVSNLPMVVLPFMKHGDLLSYIRNENNMPTVKNLMNFGIQIGKGMSYLSNLKFVHRDLAARNCMLDDDMLVKVADFGLSRDIYEREYYSSEDRKTALPIKWMALESLEKGIYSTKSDVWSFGIVLWELLTRGVSPYMEVDSWDVLKFLKQGRRLVQPAYCPPALYRLMKKCWYSDPSLRPTFDELVTSIENIISKMEKKSSEEQIAIGHNYDNIDNPAPSYLTTNQEEDKASDVEDDEDGYLKPLDNIDCSSLSTEHLQLVADSNAR